MRDLALCKAEIFRRSAEKIERKRKRRRHILTTAAPLCLCLLTVLLLYRSLEISTDSAPGDNAYAGNEAAGAPMPVYTSVEIAGASSYALEYTPDEVQALYNTVRDLFFLTVTESIPADPGMTGSGDSAVYEIVFSADGGEIAIYTLQGRTLYDQATGEHVLLTDPQYEALLCKITQSRKGEEETQ